MQSMKTSLETKVAYRTRENGEVVTRVTTESDFSDKLEDAISKKQLPPELVKKQTFQYVAAETADEPLAICGGSEDVFLAHVNYAFRLAQHHASDELLRSDGFTTTGEPYDLSQTLTQQPEGWARLSPIKKAIQDLAKGGIKVTQEQLRAELAAILDAGSTEDAT